MTIVGFDLGTKTGYCVIYDSGDVRSGVWNLQERHGQHDMREITFQSLLAHLLADTKPRLVAYEMPHLRGGAATAVLSGLVGILKAECQYRKISYTDFHTATLKKFATGKGNASKEEMVEAARIRWGKVFPEDEADARFVAALAQEEYGDD